MYGSSLTRETLILRDSRIAAREAAAMPFPRLETTPPVTKTYFVMNARCGVECQSLQETGACLKSPFTRSPRLLSKRGETLGACYMRRRSRMTAAQVSRHLQKRQVPRPEKTGWAPRVAKPCAAARRYRASATPRRGRPEHQRPLRASPGAGRC